MSLMYIEIDPRNETSLVQAYREAIALAEQLASLLPESYPLPPSQAISIAYDYESDGVTLRSLWAYPVKETTS